MQSVKQIELTLKNEPGTLSAVSELLGTSNINIIAFYVSTEKGTGNLRFVANDPDKALNVLKTAGYDMKSEAVIACETPHHPGGLNAVLKPLKDAGINVDYIYPCLGTGLETILILGIVPIEKALGVLEENWIRIIGEDLYHI